MTAASHASSVESYSLFAHRDRFAAWAAGRAAQRGLSGGTASRLGDALGRCGIRDVLRVQSRWPDSAAAFDKAHGQWCRAIVSDLGKDGVRTTYGRAAKVVAIYLKVMVVAGPAPDSRLACVAHPPIDEILLKALSRDEAFGREHRRLWRECRWTQLDETDYFEVVDSLRAEGLDLPAFWMVERYWRAG